MMLTHKPRHILRGQPNQQTAHLLAPAQPWLLALLFMAIAGLSLVAAPGVSWATFGTVPPPPPTPVTVLVGPVDSSSPESDTLTVAGVVVQTTDATRIDERVGPLVADAWVRVEGAGDGNGGLVALRIKVLPPMPLVKLIGPLDSLGDDDLQVDGIVVQRTRTTLIIGDPIPGEHNVSIRAAIESSGALLALQVVKINAIPDDSDDDDEDDDTPAGETRLTGVVMRLPDSGLTGTWIVSGIPVEATAEPRLHKRVGMLAPGAWVKIRGQAVGGTLVAKEVKTTGTKRFHKLTGALTSLTPLDVTVDGIEVELSETAAIRGNPTPGQRVQVKAQLSQRTGVLVAVFVQGPGRPGGPPPDSPPGLVIRFTGEVQQLPDDGLYGEWKIAGRTVTVPEGAFIDEHKGAVAQGAFVEVTAILGRNNSITAVLIVVTRSGDDDDGDDGDDDDYRDWTEFRDTIQALPDGDSLIGNWNVGGRTVQVTDETDIETYGRTVEVGVKVKVWGWRQPGGSVLAKRIELVKAEGRTLHFTGVIQALPDDTLIGSWTIDGRQVDVSETTQLKDHHGPFVVGARVKVYGREGEGMVQAEKIETLPAPEIQYSGRIMALPDGLFGSWTVGEKSVAVTPETELKQGNGPFALGGLVKVKGRLQGDGSIVALKVETMPMPKIEYVGEILELPDTPDLTGTWRVGRLYVEVTRDTELERDDGDFAVGAWVEVEGRMRPDGVVIAKEIETRRRR